MQSYLLQIWQNVDITILFVTHDLDEAIYLADRIVVLGRQPGHVREIISVPVPRPRDPEQMIAPHFIATRKRLDDLIHPRDGGELREIPIPRLTAVGDDVL
jgi:NitT/TauT family transport system ATP-binding protein